jgi:hypothetical protein
VPVPAPATATAAAAPFPVPPGGTAPPRHPNPPTRLRALPAGYLQLDLVDATDLTTHPLAKCLASIKVNLASNCSVSLTPLSSGGSYVPGIWADATGVDTYSKLRECPVITGTAVAGAETAAGRVAALETAFENFVYGSDKVVSATLAFSAAGTVTVTTTGPLTYAITKVSAALRLLPILLLPPE